MLVLYMKPPTVEEVRAYVAEKGYTFDPWLFFEKNTAKEWKYWTGKKMVPMKSWKGACATWQAKEQKAGYPSPDRVAEFNRRMVGAHADSYRVGFESFFGVKLREKKP